MDGKRKDGTLYLNVKSATKVRTSADIYGNNDLLYEVLDF